MRKLHKMLPVLALLFFAPLFLFNIYCERQDLLQKTQEEIQDIKTPKPGEFGTVTADNVTTDTLTLNWPVADDEMTENTELQYKVYMSTSPDIQTADDAESNGTVVMDWTYDIQSVEVSGLSDSTVYYFTVVVMDEDGNVAVYIMVEVQTSDGTLPTVNIAYPISGSYVGGTLTVSALAADNACIEKVEFYIDGVLVGEDITAPYEYLWDTTAYTDVAAFTLKAVAYDTSYVYFDNFSSQMPTAIRSNS